MLSFLLCFVHVALTVLTVACGAASASASTSPPSLFDLYTVSDGPRRAVDLDVVRDFGAVGDGVADDTAPIQAALDEAAQTQGGARVILPGRGTKFLVTPLKLGSHTTMYVEDGAALLASPDTKRYKLVPPLPSYGQGRDHPGPRYESVLSADAATDIVVTGEGTGALIDGAGEVWWEAHRSGTEKYTRGHLLEFINCTDVLVSRLTLSNSPFWTVHPYRCRNVVARELRIRNPLDSPNTDGVDPDSSENVLIENCDIRTGDDGIAIKSGWDCYGLAYGVPTVNVTVRNITVESPTSAAVCIGSEMSGGVSDVLVEGVHAINCASVLRIKAAAPRGAYVSRVTYRDVVVSNSSVVLLFDDFYGSKNPACGPSYHPPQPPEVSSVDVSDVSGTYTELAGKLNGLPNGGAITDVNVRRVRLQGVGARRVGTSWQCNEYVKGLYEDVVPTPCPSLRPKTNDDV